MIPKTLNQTIRDIVLYARANKLDEIRIVQDCFGDCDSHISRREAEKLIDYMLEEVKDGKDNSR